MTEYFDEDYFENGPQSGKSLYENYRYIPERTEPTAQHISNLFPNKRILDFGCAKGFLVKALRDLGVEAYGYDVSEYAVTHGMAEVRDYLHLSLHRVPSCDVVVGKDVLEHVPLSILPHTLDCLSLIVEEALFVVPLGDEGKYRIPCYHDDPSHVVVGDELFWATMFTEHGWKVEEFTHDISHYKAHWLEYHPQGNGVYRLRSTR